MYLVAYFNSLNGGSELVKVASAELPNWLAEHPGFLIYQLRVV
jgi:hypothetical protein